MYIHTYAYACARTRVITHKTTFIVPQKHNNSYARIKKRILSHSKPRILLKWISCKVNTQKPARKPKKCLKSNLTTLHTITQDMKTAVSGKYTQYHTQHNDNTYT